MSELICSCNDTRFTPSSFSTFLNISAFSLCQRSDAAAISNKFSLIDLITAGW